MTTLCSALRAAAASLLLAGASGAAQAAVCTGQAQAVGAEIRGPVLHVPDAESLCVALGATPDQWVELRLADVPAEVAPTSTEARSILMEAAFAQNVVCRVVAAPQREAATAICERDGRSLGAILSPATTIKASQTWR